MTTEGNIALNSLETLLKVRYFKEKDSHGSLVVIEDDDGTRRVRGFVAGEHGDIVIRPADSSVRARREAGNWHMAYRADGEEGTKPSDIQLPPKEEYDAWLAAQQKKLKPAARTGAIDKWVEVMVFVDYDAYLKHQNFLGTTNRERILREMKLYYSQMMGQVADIFRVSFLNDADMRVNISTAGIVISSEPGTSPWIEGADVQVASVPVNYNGVKTYDDLKGVENFAKWINTNTQGMSYDMAVSITGRDMRLETGGDAARGRAYLGQVCRYWRVATVEEEGNYATALTATHEIGHDLGSSHDADNSSADAAACSTYDNYVMSNGNMQRNPKNRYYFSSCSKVQMKKTLAMSASSCVNNAATDEPFTADINSKYLPGQWISYADRCTLTYGPKAVPLSYGEFENGVYNVCSDFICMNKLPSSSIGGETHVIAPLGTPCGDGMMCVEANCVADARAPKGSCYLGDTFVSWDTDKYAWNGYKYFKCAEAVPLLIAYGYTSVQDICNRWPLFKKNCCRTCGVAGGVDPAVKDALLNNQATTTTSVTMKASTAVTTTTTTRPPTTTSATTTTTTMQPPTTTTPCIDDIRIGKACLVYKTSCGLDKMVAVNGTNIGYVRDVCKSTCDRC